MKMSANELRNLDRVVFKDFSNYDPNKCNNGGSYGFWKTYTRLTSEIFEISYGTTADFDYCPVCGCFADHYDGDEDSDYTSGYSCGEFDTITEKELLKRINAFIETEDYYIDF